jgi:TatD DNase family protein
MNFSLIDTHAHLNLAAFEEDRQEIIEECLKEKIGVINVGTNYQTSLKAVELAEKYSTGLWAAIGLHPLHLGESEGDDWEIKGTEGEIMTGEEFLASQYISLFESSSRVVAIGEIGLDYSRLSSLTEKASFVQEKQKEALIKQMDLARELQLPVIIHCREAFPDLIKLFKSLKDLGRGGVIHCFSGQWEEARFFLEKGFYLGLDGVIFKTNLEEVITKAPLERILVETDCPYLTPPQRKGERNTPLNLKFIVQEVASLRGRSFQEIAQATTENAQRLFLFD